MAHDQHTHVLEVLKEEKVLQLVRTTDSIICMYFFDDMGLNLKPSVIICILCFIIIICFSGGWNRDQFYQWSANYLRLLWYSETLDISLSKQALLSLCLLFEYDAEVSRNKDLFDSSHFD